MDVTTLHPRRSDAAIHRALHDGSVVILHAESGAYHELRGSGAAIWALLDGSRALTEISDHLRSTFEAVPDDLDVVVREFVEGLIERDLVEAADRS